MSTPNAAVPKYIKKITTSTIGLTSKAMTSLVIDPARVGQKTVVMRVYGTIKGCKDGTSQFGSYTGFDGTFEAINLIDGIKYRAERCLFPGLGTQMLADALAEAKANSPDANIQFGFDIAVEESKGGKGGSLYTWVIIPLKQPDFTGENDPLAILGKSLGDLPALLNAPADQSAESSDNGKKKASK